MPDSPLYRFASAYVDRAAVLDPLGATSMGVAGHDHQMTDYSPEGYAEREALRRETLAALERMPVADDRDRICRDLMRDILALDGDTYEAGEWRTNLSIIRSPLRSLRNVFDLMPTASAGDWQVIADRLSLVPAGYAGFRRTLEDGLRQGHTAARRQVETNIAQLDAWSGAGGAGVGFFATLVERFDAAGIDDPGLRDRLAVGAANATHALTETAQFLRDRYFDAAAERDGVGRERYQLGARAYNGATLDLDETYAWGWDELYRVEREMRETCARILPGGTLAETIAHLESDPARAIEGEDAFQRWMQDLQDRTIAELDGRHFDIPEPLRRIEALIAPPGGALAMYYTGPSEDFSRPGRTWYPTGGRTTFPLWGEVSIAYHEGVPGHHLQIGTTKYLAEELSRFQRLMGGTSGYVEGWALYAERLMGELGYLENPDYYLGMLRAQALRSVRVIVDIGMHLELTIPVGERFHPGERWTAELGDAFARERSCFPESFMASEVTRYLGTPGQAISYKVGERAWLEARESARAAAAESFDLKQWHRRALEMGPMGLDQLRRELGAA